jgi:eukaryotic-like serine/threonine-protein kinase
MSDRTEMIAGRYVIEGRLGVGGMSTVLLAFDQRLERYVAVKLLAEHLADDPTFVSRFRREALAAARLVHPNIVQVFDFGLDQPSHQHFIVMEHVDGRSCAELLRDRGHLDVDQAVEIITQACRGLDYAHRNGVVHRDVKPGNLLVSDSDVVKLADFGIARAADQSSITQVGSVLGTAAYLAPEQARGEEAGPRSDLYSLGVVAYQLLSGRLPYEAMSLSELALKQQRESPIPLQRLNPQVPAELADAVAIAIDIDQEGRPADAAELAELIRDGAKGISPYDDGSQTRQLGTKAATRVLPGGSRSSGRGGRGEPPTAATRVVGAPQVGRSGRATPTRGNPVAPPRQVPARRPATYAGAEPPTERRGGGGSSGRSGGRRLFRRILLTIFLLCIVAAVIAVAAVEISSHADKTVVHYQQVVSHDAQGAISSLQKIVDKYTTSSK